MDETKIKTEYIVSYDIQEEKLLWKKMFKYYWCSCLKLYNSNYIYNVIDLLYNPI